MGSPWLFFPVTVTHEGGGWPGLLIAVQMLGKVGNADASCAVCSACLIHNIVAGCVVGPPGDKTVAQKGHLPWDSSFWPRHPKYREGPPSKIR